jgi:hypothetical protein
MPPVGFETTISAGKRPKTYAFFFFFTRARPLISPRSTAALRLIVQP